MQRMISFILALFKWPLAFLMLFGIVPAFKADLLILPQEDLLPLLKTFYLPILTILALWLLFPCLGTSKLSVLTHEITHMLFAILTGNKPQDIRIKDHAEGEFIFIGRCNWLIALSPYFFPTIPFIIMVLGGFYAWLGQTPPAGYWYSFGFGTGFYLMTTFSQIHIGQTDFKTAGRLFSLTFLPGANLIMYGFLTAYARFGFDGLEQYARILINQCHLFLNLL